MSNDVDVHVRGRVSGVAEAANAAKDSIADLKQNVVREAAEMAGVSGDLAASVARVGGAFALVAGAAAVTWAAYADGRREMYAMNLALASTGNFAGQTRDSLRGLAGEMAAHSQVTIGEAKDVATALAASGRIGQEAFGSVTRLAADFARVMGSEVDKVAPQLVKLFADPARGAEELNRQLHFLTLTELESIRTLEEMGRGTEAQALLADLLKGKLDEVNGKVEAQISLWQRVKKFGGEAWDFISGIGRDTPVQQRLRELEQKKAPGRGVFAGLSPDEQREYDLLTIAADEQAAQARADAARGETNDRNIAAWKLIEGKSTAARASAIDNQIAKVRGFEPETVDQANAQAEAVRKLQEERAKLFDTGKKGADIAQQEANAMNHLQDMIDRAGGQASEFDSVMRKLTDGPWSKFSATAQANLLALAGEADEVREAKKAWDEFDRQTQEYLRHQVQVARATAAMDESVRGLKAGFARDNARTVEARDMPAAQRELAEALRKVEEQAQQARDALAQKAAAIGMDEAALQSFTAAVVAANEEEARQKDTVRLLWEEQQRLNDSWEAGARKGLREYAEEAAKTGERVGQSMKRGAQMAEDALTEMVMKGKLSLRSLFDYAAAQAVRENFSKPVVGGVSGLIGKLFGNSGPAPIASEFADLWMPTLDFEGGGYTGAGARAGGLDGKGGFLAMVHPDETVVDHRAPGAAASAPVTVVQYLNFAVGVAQTVRAEVMNLMPQISAAALGAVQDARLRGGSARLAFRG